MELAATANANDALKAKTLLDMCGFPFLQDKAQFDGSTINVLDNFTNHDYDEILGVYYANARFYDPYLMRFLTVDPARDGDNWYEYADGNPLKYVDPLGLWMSFGEAWRSGAKIMTNTIVEWVKDVYEGAKSGISGMVIGIGVPVSSIVNGSCNAFNPYIDNNYAYNSTFQFSGPVYSQYHGAAATMKMGYWKATWNGCSWVAAFNALYLLGNTQQPADIIKFYEENMGGIVNGYLGVNPIIVDKYISDQGYDTEMYNFPLHDKKRIDDRIKESNVSILAYIHGSGAHYVAIEYNSLTGLFNVYNDASAGSKRNVPGQLASIAEWIEDKGYNPLSIITIK